MFLFLKKITLKFLFGHSVLREYPNEGYEIWDSGERVFILITDEKKYGYYCQNLAKKLMRN